MSEYLQQVSRNTPEWNKKYHLTWKTKYSVAISEAYYNVSTTDKTVFFLKLNSYMQTDQDRPIQK